MIGNGTRVRNKRDGRRGIVVNSHNGATLYTIKWDGDAAFDVCSDYYLLPLTALEQLAECGE